MNGLGARKPDRAGRKSLPPGYEYASDDEQRLYDAFVGGAKMMLFDGGPGLQQTAHYLQQAGDPVEAIADIASIIAGRVYTAARDKGEDIPADVLLHGGHEIVADVAELAQALGLGQFEPQQIDQAFYRAADKFGGMARQMGAYSDKQAEQDKADLDQMADSGDLERLLGGLKMKATPLVRRVR